MWLYGTHLPFEPFSLKSLSQFCFTGIFGILYGPSEIYWNYLDNCTAVKNFCCILCSFINVEEMTDVRL